MSTIMLAKGYDEKKLEFPVEITEKIDGVAARFDYTTTNGYKVTSRQGKPIESVNHIIKALNKSVHLGASIIGELYIPTTPFKEASGIIRRKHVDERIRLAVYDIDFDYVSAAYLSRMAALSDVCGYALGTGLVKRVPVVGKVYDIAALNDLVGGYKPADPTVHEGFVIRSLFGEHSYYDVGKRSWGMMKLKPKPTVDLKVVGFEQATANKEMTFLGETFQKGEGLHAVGRINVEYKDKIIGVGAGCLTHKERRELWEDLYFDQVTGLNCRNMGRICEVEYMKDDSYDALRQPVFKRWRDDKTEPSYD